jgi:hypothetical protein
MQVEVHELCCVKETSRGNCDIRNYDQELINMEEL